MSEAFPFGVYRFIAVWPKNKFVRVRFASGEMNMPEAMYRAEGLKPAFDTLPAGGLPNAAIHNSVIQREERENQTFVVDNRDGRHERADD